MKSKEEILAKYYTQGADGMPEIAAEGLLKAMEEYRLQAEEAAFNAAKEYESGIPGGKELFETFEDYKASLIAPAPAPQAEPSEADTIQFMADSILDMFIPNDKTVEQISFDIRTNGKAYEVSYKKTAEGYWIFENYTPAE